MKVQLTRDHKGHAKGTILTLPSDEGERLVASGVGIAPSYKLIPHDRMVRNTKGDITAR